MNTHTHERTDSIASLEYELECGSSFHVGPHQRADFWIDAHGCDECVMCSKCLEILRTSHADSDRMLGRFKCSLCMVAFPSWMVAVTVVPL
ncbi:hypothetical protein SAMN05421776_12127 [Nocardia farcinica]|uniref:Uncharacterized protein n=1 Tax=Nocardia farcinica TaxID=37329 RepID=A0A0H5P8U6_NOCFR|nr:hypothetical protein [Nocardia farcinica]AXK88569.1 hypothetical protein DXT66_25760 [Nocardia farcinica]PFW98878.1 hypothetical protein CJ469_05839 [Nocardia farcinica]PFX04484.1 hypothetical protein CJ468_05460 [Nocardia farcinica]CRY84275.1 Uncharacterised protein [Nocardia farcinica]SIT34070.1 hypothetical protein SAMN05421776_12127 [Nocardia farcinica]